MKRDKQYYENQGKQQAQDAIDAGALVKTKTITDDLPWQQKAQRTGWNIRVDEWVASKYGTGEPFDSEKLGGPDHGMEGKRPSEHEGKRNFPLWPAQTGLPYPVWPSQKFKMHKHQDELLKTLNKEGKTDLFIPSRHAGKVVRNYPIQGMAAAAMVGRTGRAMLEVVQLTPEQAEQMAKDYHREYDKLFGGSLQSWMKAREVDFSELELNITASILTQTKFMRKMGMAFKSHLSIARTLRACETRNHHISKLVEMLGTETDGKRKERLRRKIEVMHKRQQVMG